MKNTLKIALTFLAMLLLLAPLLQKKLKIFQLDDLGGTQSKVQWVEFSKDDWFSGVYQERKSSYIEQTLGFRNSMIRLNNQIAYSIFDYAKANGVVVGKENYLYESGYIHAELGLDFIGDSAILEKSRLVKASQDSLASRGVHLLLIFLPGKGSFFPEFIPNSYISESQNPRNIDRFKENFDELDIQYLDFHSWFMNMKDTSRYPIYPKNGTHWSKYAELLASDSIAHYVSKKFQTSRPKMRFDSIVVSTIPQDTDDDIEDGMNLFFDIPDLPMAYPQFDLQIPHDYTRPKATIVGDSYYWGFYNYGFQQKLFANNQFWYYNMEIFDETGYKIGKVPDVNIQMAVEEQDLVIVMVTDAQLPSYGFGFFEQIAGSYQKPKEYLKKEEIKRISKVIQESEEWLETVKQLSRDKSISLDSAIYETAKYYVNTIESGQSL